MTRLPTSVPAAIEPANATVTVTGVPAIVGLGDTIMSANGGGMAPASEMLNCPALAVTVPPTVTSRSPVLAVRVVGTVNCARVASTVTTFSAETAPIFTAALTTSGPVDGAARSVPRT